MTTWESWYQKGKTSLDLNEARWGCSGISWTICKQSAPHSRQITTPTPHHSIFTGPMPFLIPIQQCQSTKGKALCWISDKGCIFLTRLCFFNWRLLCWHSGRNSVVVDPCYKQPGKSTILRQHVACSYTNQIFTACNWIMETSKTDVTKTGLILHKTCTKPKSFTTTLLQLQLIDHHYVTISQQIPLLLQS